MKVLGITSAIGIVGAALAEDNKVLSECSVSSRIMQSEKLITMVENVLKKTGIKINDIDAIAVTNGPGSYSGLRGGLATAKALTAALNIPIIAVSTLHAIAYNFIDHNGTLAIAVNACRDDFNFSLWGANMGKIKRMTNDITVKSMQIIDNLSKMQGKITLAADEKLSGKIRNENVIYAAEINIVPWAANVAKIGLEKLRKKEIDDYLTIVPSYSHSPNIREFKK